MVAALSARLRRPVRLHVSSDYQALYSDVEKGIEIAWLPPLVHARAASFGATLVAVSLRGASLTYRSALVVRKDHPAADCRALGQVRAAWTDRRSASGFLFPRLHLLKAGVTLASEAFLGAGSSVCAAVADGSADVGAGHVSEEAGDDQARALLDVMRHYTASEWRLRVLEVTGSIPPDGIVVGPGVPAAERAQICAALLGIHESPEGKAALADLLSAEKLVAVDSTVESVVAQIQPLLSLVDG
jgi:ABC-type phosphate/phosphonate transport system substrate-binding protein